MNFDGLVRVCDYIIETPEVPFPGSPHLPPGIESSPEFGDPRATTKDSAGCVDERELDLARKFLLNLELGTPAPSADITIEIDDVVVPESIPACQSLGCPTAIQSAGSDPEEISVGHQVYLYFAERSWFRREKKIDKTTLLGTSYVHLLYADKKKYDPFFLDNPRIQMYYRTTDEANSVNSLPLHRPGRRQKEEGNENFQKLHPWLPKNLTLSKLRNLKRDLLRITYSIPELDISTVAASWVYFERLIEKRYVHKHNRKLVAGACLVLAFKFNQSFSKNGFKRMATSIRQMDSKDRLSINDLHAIELSIFTELEFSLKLNAKDVLPHIDQLLAQEQTTFREYYDADSTPCATDSSQVANRPSFFDPLPPG